MPKCFFQIYHWTLKAAYVLAGSHHHLHRSVRLCGHVKKDLIKILTYRPIWVCLSHLFLCLLSATLYISNTAENIIQPSHAKKKKQQQKTKNWFHGKCAQRKTLTYHQYTVRVWLLSYVDIHVQSCASFKPSVILFVLIHP